MKLSFPTLVAAGLVLAAAPARAEGIAVALSADCLKQPNVVSASYTTLIEQYASALEIPPACADRVTELSQNLLCYGAGYSYGHNHTPNSAILKPRADALKQITLPQRDAESDPCFRPLMNLYVLLSFDIYASQPHFDEAIKKPHPAEQSYVSPFILSLAKAGTFQFLTHQARASAGGIWSELGSDSKVSKYLVIGGYACDPGLLWIDANVAPFDLVGGVLHEIDHLVRDKLSVIDPNPTYTAMSGAERVAVDETLATLLQGYSQIEFIRDHTRSNLHGNLGFLELVGSSHLGFNKHLDAPYGDFDLHYFKAGGDAYWLTRNYFDHAEINLRGQWQRIYTSENGFSGFVASRLGSDATPRFHLRGFTDHVNAISKHVLEHYFVTQQPFDSETLGDLVIKYAQSQHTADFGNERPLASSDWAYSNQILKNLREPTPQCIEFQKEASQGDGLRGYIGSNPGKPSDSPGISGVGPGQSGLRLGSSSVKPCFSGEVLP